MMVHDNTTTQSIIRVGGVNTSSNVGRYGGNGTGAAEEEAKAVAVVIVVVGRKTIQWGTSPSA